MQKHEGILESLGFLAVRVSVDLGPPASRWEPRPLVFKPKSIIAEVPPARRQHGTEVLGKLWIPLQVLERFLYGYYKDSLKGRYKGLECPEKVQ